MLVSRRCRSSFASGRDTTEECLWLVCKGCTFTARRSVLKYYYLFCTATSSVAGGFCATQRHFVRRGAIDLFLFPRCAANSKPIVCYFSRLSFLSFRRCLFVAMVDVILYQKTLCHRERPGNIACWEDFEARPAVEIDFGFLCVYHFLNRAMKETTVEQ